MKAHQEQFPVAVMGRLLDVSRSGFYSMEQRGSGPRAIENVELAEEITEIHRESRGHYGSPRVHLALKEKGNRCGVNRMARMMKVLGLEGVRQSRKRVRTTDSSHSHGAAPNLIKDLEVVRPDQVWAGDITYLRVGSGWVYLAAVIDLYTRKVVGWAIAESLHATVVIDALNEALATRDWSPGLIFHSDRGVQYACREFRNLLNGRGITQSMSAQGNCYDNAVMESFFGTLKAEETGPYANTHSARRGIFDYVETYYNRQRIHTSLDGQSPEAFEHRYWEAATEAPQPAASEEFSEACEAPLVEEVEGLELCAENSSPQDQWSHPPKYSLEGCSPAEPSSASLEKENEPSYWELTRENN